MMFDNLADLVKILSTATWMGILAKGSGKSNTPPWAPHQLVAVVAYDLLTTHLHQE